MRGRRKTRERDRVTRADFKRMGKTPGIIYDSVEQVMRQKFQVGKNRWN
jgi:hypothetical protein